MTELRAEAVTLRAGDRLLVRDFDLCLVTGEMVGIRGPSGCGKSTLLMTLAGFVAPAAGRILLDGRPVIPWRETTVAVVPQTLPHVEVLTVAETVSLPLQAAALPGREIDIRTDTALAALGLAALRGQLLPSLSGGQRQRVAIAQVMARQPAVVLADEPTTALDARWRESVLERLAELAHGGGALVVVASNDGDTLAGCDRQVSLSSAAVPGRSA